MSSEAIGLIGYHLSWLITYCLRQCSQFCYQQISCNAQYDNMVESNKVVSEGHFHLTVIYKHTFYCADNAVTNIYTFPNIHI